MTSAIAANTFKCLGIKKPQYSRNGTQYAVAKMQEVSKDGYSEPSKMLLFDTDVLLEKSYKGKYFVFGKVNQSGGVGLRSVSLKQRFEVYSSLDDVPLEDINSDDEYF